MLSGKLSYVRAVAPPIISSSLKPVLRQPHLHRKVVGGRKEACSCWLPAAAAVPTVPSHSNNHMHRTVKKGST